MSARQLPTHDSRRNVAGVDVRFREMNRSGWATEMVETGHSTPLRHGPVGAQGGRLADCHRSSNPDVPSAGSRGWCRPDLRQMLGDLLFRRALPFKAHPLGMTVWT